jgi:hypothetical protein
MTEKPKKPPAKLTDKQREALDRGRKTFKQGEARTKVFGSEGGKKSGEVRQEKAQARTFAQHLAEELELLNKDGEPLKREIARKFIQQVKNASPKTAAKLFEVLRDTLGEAPIPKVDLNATGNINIGNWRDKLPTVATDAAATPATDQSEEGSGTEASGTTAEANGEEENAPEDLQEETPQDIPGNVETAAETDETTTDGGNH